MGERIKRYNNDSTFFAKIQKSEKKARTRKSVRAFGTPERTLTSDLPLRRRPLYTTELLGRISLLLYPYCLSFVNAKKGEKPRKNYCNPTFRGL